MKIAEVYSHLNGVEFLLVHHKQLWNEIQHVIRDVDAPACKTKVSKEKRTAGTVFYSPIAMNKQFQTSL